MQLSIRRSPDTAILGSSPAHGSRSVTIDLTSTESASVGTLRWLYAARTYSATARLNTGAANPRRLLDVIVA
jgi:hypothetical protein